MPIIRPKLFAVSYSILLCCFCVCILSLMYFNSILSYLCYFRFHCFPSYIVVLNRFRYSIIDSRSLFLRRGKMILFCCDCYEYLM